MAAQGNPVLGDYELVARVAAGGMATLYLAHRNGEEGKALAVKVMHPDRVEDWEATRWFIDEALIAIRLKHPNVVRVHELGESDGTYFLAMEYVHGCTLAHLCSLAQRRGMQLDPRLVAWIGGQICRGLHSAHELRNEEGEPMQVIHRDLSPQNVLLSHLGEVKLIDFGVAKADGRARRTSHGEMRGKLRYMAPEQASAEPMDRRADLFSLGVVLWETTAMRRLHHPDLEMTELLEAVQEPQVPLLGSLRPGIDSAFAESIAWATRPDVEDRPRTAAELGAMLEDGAGPVGQPELAEVIRLLVGDHLLETASAFPEPILQSLALQHLERTDSRRDGTGRVSLEHPEGPPPSRRQRQPTKGAGPQLALLGLLALLFLGAVAAVAYFYL